MHTTSRNTNKKTGLTYTATTAQTEQCASRPAWLNEAKPFLLCKVSLYGTDGVWVTVEAHEHTYRTRAGHLEGAGKLWEDHRAGEPKEALCQISERYNLIVPSDVLARAYEVVSVGATRKKARAFLLHTEGETSSVCAA